MPDSSVSSVYVAACEAISKPVRCFQHVSTFPNGVLTARTPLQLFDAATVANSRHAAAWHGWGLLEKREGNLVKARDLWMKVRGTVACCTASLLHVFCIR